MKYLGETIPIPVNYFEVLIIILIIKTVFERAKKHFSDVGQMLIIIYYQLIITFPFVLLQPVNFKDTLINYFF